jgi:hypothetical protein
MVLRKNGRVGRRPSLEKDISFAGILFCVVGHPSATAAALRWHSTESGAGRLTNFMLPPLTFQEYIHLKKLDHLLIQGGC